VDARDLAAWMLDMAEQGRTGPYNASGPARPLTLGELLEECRRESGSDARFTWMDERSLLGAGVGRAMELPLWMPGMPGAARADCGRAIAAGLAFRPLAETIRDTHAWDTARPPGRRRAGLSREREAELLRAWHAARHDGAPALAPA
jgi:2'-hydroxyisoflavone reductase